MTPKSALLMAVISPVLALQSYAQTTIYQTDFSNFASGTDYRTDFNVSLGGNSFPNNHKEVSFGQWGITGNGNSFSDGFLRPQKNPATNLKMAGLFLDPSSFIGGAGTYTISFDLTGDTAGNTAYRAYVFSGSGYDLTGTTNDQLDLKLSAGGFGGYTGLTAEGNAVASQLKEVILNSEATTSGVSPVKIDFEYDGSSAIAFSIGGYNNAATIDNFIVTGVPEPSSYGMIVGILGLGMAMLRRRA